MAIKRNRPGILLPMRVWDAPTRLFHLAVIVLVVVGYAASQFAGAVDAHTALLGMQVHLACGYALLALLIFRVAWGFVGSDTALFASFLAAPRTALHHLARLRVREPDMEVGHNPAGGWMVVLLLLLLAVLVATGLCANDDATMEGPFARFVGKPMSDALSLAHSISFDVLLAAVALHVLAVIFYAVAKGQNLVRPMITGKKRLPAATKAPRMASPGLAAMILAAAGAIAWVVATQIWRV